MKVRSESGNTLLIVGIVIGSIAILGLLGWVIWGNFVNTSQESNKITTFEQCKSSAGSKLLLTFPEQCVTADGQTFIGQNIQTDDSMTVKSYCTEAEKLCFEYPDGWTIDTLKADGGGESGFKGDLLKVASPDKKIVLTFESGIGGLGGTCPEEDRVAVNVLASTPAASLSGYKDEYHIDVPHVARVAYERDGSFTAALYLTTVAEYSTIGVIDRCGIGFSQFIDGRNSVLSSEFAGAGVMQFGYDSTTSDGVPTYKTLEAAKAAFDTPVYKQAASLLASVHYE